MYLIQNILKQVCLKRVKLVLWLQVLKIFLVHPVGDTITLVETTPDVAVFTRTFKKVKPQVYAGLFPIDASDFEPFREALHKTTN